MIKAIAELKQYNARLTTVLNELEVLEDGEGADWSEVVTDFHWLLNQCEHRLVTLKQRDNNATKED